MIKIYYDLKLRLTYLINGIKTRNNFHLGDTVKYENKKWVINNAVKSCGQCRTRIYDLVELYPNRESSGRKHPAVCEPEIKKIRNADNFWRGIFSVYDFNMKYWHEINIEKATLLRSKKWK